MGKKKGKSTDATPVNTPDNSRANESASRKTEEKRREPESESRSLKAKSEANTPSAASVPKSEQKTDETKPTNAVEEKMKGITADWVKKSWESVMAHSPDKPEEWLKQFADDLINATKDVPARQDDGVGLLKYLDPPTKGAVVHYLVRCEEAGRTVGSTQTPPPPPPVAWFFADLVLRFMELSIEKKKVPPGLTLAIQCILVLDATHPRMFAVSIGSIILRNHLMQSKNPKPYFPDCPVEGTKALLWVYHQLLQYSPPTFILVWKALLMHVVWSQMPLPNPRPWLQNL